MSTDHDTLNKRIALAAGWTHTPGKYFDWRSPDGKRECRWYPPFHTDANAALEAARVIVGEFTITRCKNDWVVFPVDMQLRIIKRADTAALALAAMCEAVLATKQETERE